MRKDDTARPARQADDSEQSPGFEAVKAERTLLINLSYRLLGSVADAEDAVQEGYLRWYRLSEQDQAAIESPSGWLIKVVCRICLDMLRSARSRRERYVGEWLPEPVPEAGQWASHRACGGELDPADRVTLDESVSMAVLVVLEAMTPAERVAFVLHDVFRYSFTEVSEIVGRTPQACRKLASSARQRLNTSRQVIAPSSEHAAVVRAFKRAWETGDLAGLIALLAPEATAITDGGGRVSASVEPIETATSIAEFLLGVRDRQPNLQIGEALVNGEAGLVAQADGTTLAVIALETAKQRIHRVWAIRNPDKLGAWTPL
ncbi:RNA polymerase sigma factor SigJ [Geodermatophilus sp. DSM 44513]|uniref:RNA polymerase sigma factor SigJ n=1 Tax=Geodermatophilus sp. DSM 44513 TaxID=1528104 RepID=UPI00128074E8|nr:RNA polymerase sigma factor SigJ [Geodermatophilus sp. DSM 44513]WNV75172.1 RNA polymerase sigma factor SigJ [Geodermatophilus sp. DSM 44513]